MVSSGVHRAGSRCSPAEIPRVTKEHETAEDKSDVGNGTAAKHAIISRDESLHLRKDQIAGERQPDDAEHRVKPALETKIAGSAFVGGHASPRLVEPRINHSLLRFRVRQLSERGADGPRTSDSGRLGPLVLTFYTGNRTIV